MLRVLIEEAKWRDNIFNGDGGSFPERKRVNLIDFLPL